MKSVRDQGVRKECARVNGVKEEGEERGKCQGRECQG
jgi:hypothetical protein